MAIELSPELQCVVQRLLATQRYESEFQVVSEALRLLEQREQLRNEIAESIAELDRGQRISADEVFEEMYAKITAAGSEST